MDSQHYKEQLDTIKKWFADGEIEKVLEKLTEIIHQNFSKNVQRDFEKKKLYSTAIGFVHLWNDLPISAELSHITSKRQRNISVRCTSASLFVV